MKPCLILIRPLLRAPGLSVLGLWFCLLLAAVTAPARAGDYDAEDQESRRKVADFMGGVLGKSGIVTGRKTGVTSDGTWVSLNGRGFATSRGYYGSRGNQIWGQDTLVVRSGQRFYGTRSAWRNGPSYTDQDGESVWITTSSDPDE